MASDEAEDYLREAISLKTLAHIYDMSYHTVCDYVRHGVIPRDCVVSIGKSKRIKLKPFKEWLERRNANA